MDTTLKFSSSFHPQIDGQSEEANSTVLDLLKCYVSEHKAKWQQYLSLVEYAYNNTVHSSTGKAPFEIVEGGKKVQPILHTKDKIFEADKYVQDMDEMYKKIHNAFHVSLLRPYVGDVPKDMLTEEQLEVEELDEILVPEQILAHKERKSERQVAVIKVVGVDLKGCEATRVSFVFFKYACCDDDQGFKIARPVFLQATMKIGKEEGIQGYWRGYFPQVIRVVPYSAVQLVAYEAYKKLFKGEDEGLSISGRLAAGACAGMTSTLITYPLDVLRLRLAVDPASKSMLQVASTMLREEGLASFYKGLGPSLLGIAPYVALNFCAFDLIKKALPEDVQKTPTASFVTAFLSASLATSMCYPLDTARRQLQMKDTPFLTIGDALPGIFLSLFSLILCSTFYFPVPLPFSR
ncbi:hypothetical protein L7F22_032831 [Adiantum nelumboides]|nr:hypothetical protein [Adiantum nelumboides]